MRTKGALGSVPISLAILNSVLKPNATVMVSKKFAENILALCSNTEAQDAVIKNLTDSEEAESPISVESY